MATAAEQAGARVATAFRNYGREWALNYKKRLRTERRRIRQTKNPIGTWRIVKGDLVQQLTGKDAGKTGKVTRVHRPSQRVWVEGLNMNSRFQRAENDKPGGVLRMESSTHYSNIQLVDPSTQKPTRTGVLFKEDGTKVRVSNSTGTVIAKSAELKERTRSRGVSEGPLDTLNADVAQVTFQGVEAEYAALQALRAARRKATVEAQGLAWKYADAEEGLFQTLKPEAELRAEAAARARAAPTLSPAAQLAYPESVAHLTGIREDLSPYLDAVEEEGR